MFTENLTIVSNCRKIGQCDFTFIFWLLYLTMLNFLIGWVELARFQLLATNLVSLTDYVWITESLNPTLDSALSR